MWEYSRGVVDYGRSGGMQVGGLIRGGGKVKEGRDTSMVSLTHSGLEAVKFTGNNFCTTWTSPVLTVAA